MNRRQRKKAAKALAAAEGPARGISKRRVAVLIVAATEGLGSRGAALRWIRAPNRALGGLSPLEVAATEAGFTEVQRVLGRIEHGIFG